MSVTVTERRRREKKVGRDLGIDARPSGLRFRGLCTWKGENVRSRKRHMTFTQEMTRAILSGGLRSGLQKGKVAERMVKGLEIRNEFFLLCVIPTTQ